MQFAVFQRPTIRRSSIVSPFFLSFFCWYCLAHNGVLQEGLKSFEGGDAMDRARAAVNFLLRGDQGGAASSDLDAAIIEVTFNEGKKRRLFMGHSHDSQCMLVLFVFPCRRSNVCLCLFSLPGGGRGGTADDVCGSSRPISAMRVVSLVGNLDCSSWSSLSVPTL